MIASMALLYLNAKSTGQSGVNPSVSPSADTAEDPDIGSDGRKSAEIERDANIRVAAPAATRIIAIGSDGRKSAEIERDANIRVAAGAAKKAAARRVGSMDKPTKMERVATMKECFQDHLADCKVAQDKDSPVAKLVASIGISKDEFIQALDEAGGSIPEAVSMIIRKKTEDIHVGAKTLKSKPLDKHALRGELTKTERVAQETAAMMRLAKGKADLIKDQKYLEGLVKELKGPYVDESLARAALMKNGGDLGAARTDLEPIIGAKIWLQNHEEI